MCICTYTNQTTATYKLYFLGFYFLYLPTKVVDHSQTAWQLAAASVWNNRYHDGPWCHLPLQLKPPLHLLSINPLSIFPTHIKIEIENVFLKLGPAIILRDDSPGPKGMAPSEGEDGFLPCRYLHSSPISSQGDFHLAHVWTKCSVCWGPRGCAPIPSLSSFSGAWQRAQHTPWPARSPLNTSRAQVAF